MPMQPGQQPITVQQNNTNYVSGNDRPEETARRLQEVQQKDKSELVLMFNNAIR